MNLEDGIHYDIPFTDYLSIDALSQSGIKRLMKSPAHYLVKTESTPAMELGRAIHAIVLEGRHPTDVAALKPASRKPTDTQRNAKNPSVESMRAMAEWEEFAARSEGKVVLSHVEFGCMVAITESIRRSDCAQQFLGQLGRAEVTMVWTDPETGVRCKGRIDWLTEAGIPCDLKTCRDASPSAFGRHAWNMGYVHQDQFYRTGLQALTGQRPETFVIVAAETDEPYCVAAYYSDEAACERAQVDIVRASLVYSHCKATHHWPAVYAGAPIKQLRVPGWALRDDNGETDDNED